MDDFFGADVVVLRLKERAVMVTKKDKWGNEWHEGPLTLEEERDFYRRTAGGPITVLKRPATAVAQTAPPPRQEEGPQS